MAHEIDVVVFGVTGFTGSYCLRKLIIHNKEHGKNYKLGASGRNEDKVKKIVKEICDELNFNESDIKIIWADVDDQQSLNNLTRQSKVLINAVGPYQLYGTPVVLACIENSTHYVDLSGEPQFVEKIQSDYHEIAKEKGIFIISSCGFDSIPTDCGIQYLKKQLPDFSFDQIEGYIVTDNDKDFKVNIGTFHSLVESISNYKQLRKIRNSLYPKIIKKKIKFQNKLKRKLFPFKTPFSDKYFIPFWQVDKAVLRRTQALILSENENFQPVQFEQYFEIPNYLFYFIFILFVPILAILCQFKFTKNLLLTYPEIFTFGFFSKNPPTHKQVAASKFTYYLSAKEIKNNFTQTRTLCIKGPEIAYDATSIFIVASAITILEDLVKEKTKAGVLPPGYAFQNTKLIDRIKQFGIEFELI